MAEAYRVVHRLHEMVSFPMTDDPPRRPAPPREWKVLMTVTGGELGEAVETIEISVKGSKAVGVKTRKGGHVAPFREERTLTMSSCTRLFRTLHELGAWDLPDVRQSGKDIPHHAVRLAWEGRMKTIDIQGFTGSEPHRKLVLSIERCFAQRSPP